MQFPSKVEVRRQVSRRMIALVAGSVAAASLSAPAAAQSDIESTRRALGIIDDFARSMCADPDLKGFATTASANAKASAGVSNLVKSLADAKVDLSADIKRESFQGLLRTDLLEATRNATNCRLTIYNDLKDRVLPRKSDVSVPQPPPNPSLVKKAPATSAQSAASPADASKLFAKLLEYVGLPRTAKIGWGTQYEDIERLIPSSERTISRTDAIGFSNRTTVNEVPAATVLLFEQRRLTEVRLDFSASYSERRKGHMINTGESDSDLGSNGDKSKAELACGNKYLGELVKKLDANFSKVADLSCKVATREEPSSRCIKESKCRAENTDSTCTAAYKHPEASQILLNYKRNIGKESYISGYYAYWSNDSSCRLELVFRDASTRAGI